MNKQKVLENFVLATDGKGRSLRKTNSKTELCCYFPKDHPGCAIGCQPGFREKFGNRQDTDMIADWFLESDELEAKLNAFFQIIPESTEDIDAVNFLSDLQDFHDKRNNWNEDNCIKPTALKQFCAKWELNPDFERPNLVSGVTK